MVTITGCEVSFDRSYVQRVLYRRARAATTTRPPASRPPDGRIRSLHGACAMHWRVTPELRFLLDASVDEAQRIAEALAGDAGRNEEGARKNADFDDSVYHRDGEDDDFEDEE